MSGGYQTRSSLNAVNEMTKLQKLTQTEILRLKSPFVGFFTFSDSLVGTQGDIKWLKKALSQDRKFVAYPYSSHVITIDIDHEDMEEETIRFFGKY